MIRIVSLSDTHNEHKSINVPDGDIFIHAGDSTANGTLEELRDFAEWVNALPHQYKVIIAGNHDSSFETNPYQTRKLFNESVIYLENDMVTVLGINIWGSPVVPRSTSRAFAKTRGEDMRQHWRYMPSDIDILITHCPPAGVLDTSKKGHSCGCEWLVHKVRQVKPKLHFFGHIHESSGHKSEYGIDFHNVAYLHSGERSARVIDIDPESW